MLTVLRVHLPSEIPIVGCEITPYVLVRKPDGGISSEDVPETAPIGGYCMRYKWYRVHNDRKVAICSVHPTEQATLQCLGCVKAKVPVPKSYHCSPKCFSDAWQHHRVLHERALSASNENGSEEEEVYGRFSSSGSANANAGLSSSTSNVGQTPSQNNGTAPLYPSSIPEKIGGKSWFEVGRSRTTLTVDDINHVLKLECIPIDAETRIPFGIPCTFLTSCVIPAPSPIPRCMIPVDADILCLQEVQGDHFEEFFV